MKGDCNFFLQIGAQVVGCKKLLNALTDWSHIDPELILKAGRYSEYISEKFHRQSRGESL